MAKLMLQFASEPTMSMSCWFLKLALWSQIVFQHKSHLDGKADAAICFKTHNEYELLLFPSFSFAPTEQERVQTFVLQVCILYVRYLIKSLTL
jgi:hypothetical protein